SAIGRTLSKGGQRRAGPMEIVGRLQGSETVRLGRRRPGRSRHAFPPKLPRCAMARRGALRKEGQEHREGTRCLLPSATGLAPLQGRAKKNNTLAGLSKFACLL